ncbi:hypothetical protein [Kistimonas scapharcae]|uniref:hypothetical protein n=1 Tax=Kistimonas scapharcae TaxID=1036133 RepID=UPI0031E7263C
MRNVHKWRIFGVIHKHNPSIRLAALMLLADGYSPSEIAAELEIDCDHVRRLLA